MNLLMRWQVLMVFTFVVLVAPATAEEPRKIVIIAGQKSHGPEGNRVHDYPWSARLLKVMLDNCSVSDQLLVEYYLDGWPKNERVFDDAATIVIISDGRDGDAYREAPQLESPERVAFVDRLMKRGCGLVTFHFSTFGPDQYAAQMLRWNGGFFKWEADGESKRYSAIATLESDVRLLTPAHPTLRGIKPFRLREEFYYNIRFNPLDRATRPILNVPALAGREPDGRVVAWAREREDGGRGFGTSCGHFYDNWRNDDFRRLMLNAIVWTAGIDVPGGGVDGRFYTHEQITDALSGVSGMTRAAATTDKPIRALILTGRDGPFHDWRTTSLALKEALERDPRFVVTITTNIEDLVSLDLGRFDVLLQNYCNWQIPHPLSDAAKAAFTSFLDRGGGLVIVHFANGAWHFSLPDAGASDWPEYRRICRRVWNHIGKGESQSAHDAYGPFKVHVTGFEHPITAGLKDFDTTDELYFRQDGSEPIEPLVLAHSKATGRDEPLAWAYSYGKGSVFQTLLGHDAHSVRNAGEPICRGAAWASRRTVGRVYALEENLNQPALVRKEPQQVSVRGQTSSSPASAGRILEGKPDYRVLPLTVECRAKLESKQEFNVLVASDTKSSSEHWELYSYAGSGVLSVFQPGRGVEVRSDVNVCDGAWHYLAAVLEPARVRLFVDGKLVKDAPAQALTGTPLPGGLGLGTLVEGDIRCDGVIEDVRISRGVREISAVAMAPLERDAQTIGLWHLTNADGLLTVQRDPWAVEDPNVRASLPEFREISPASLDELTPALGWPRPEAMTNWHRSHGDATSSRFSALKQINRENVSQLEAAWTYHSRDGTGNIQCNPIIVDGVMFAPTAGNYIVAINAETGSELWRFKPEKVNGGYRLEDAAARRGIVYWSGEGDAPKRLLFTAGNWIYALDPLTGKPIENFGQAGRTRLSTGGTVIGAVYKQMFVIPGFGGDVFGYDVVNGKLLWTFHTVPHPGEFGFDTWNRTESGANCWGGMALDEQRGIAYVATGSPKPNFTGGGHKGDDLFANCVIALDAMTGKRLWHFQEIRHDIWDLDIPAPPNLVTITRDGKRVDALAQVTKIGNTLLLDRVTGKPIFPVRLRRAPASKLPGEWTAPYQPDVELPEPFARQTFTRDDITKRTEDAHDYTMKRIANANFGWFEPFEDGKPTIYYGIHGGGEWTGAAYDPTTGFLYISANELPWIETVFRDDNEPPRDPKKPTLGDQLYQKSCAACHGADRVGVGVAPPLRGLRHRLTDANVIALWKIGRGLMPVAPPMTQPEQKALLDFLFLRDGLQPANTDKPSRPAYTVNGYNRMLDQEGYPAIKPPWGTLNCIDLNTGKIRWKVPLGEYPELTADGIPKTGTENFGGAIVTAGELVFCSGTRDNMIRAFDKDTGAELWSRKLPLHGTAAPSTYLVDGRQFVVIAATGGGKLGGPVGDAYVAFALPPLGAKKSP